MRKVRLVDLPSEGVPLSLEEPATWLAEFFPPGDELRELLTGPVRFEGKVERIDTTLVLHGDVSASLRPVCHRCLEPFDLKIHESIFFRLVHRAEDADRMDLEEDAMSYSGEYLDLLEVLGEIVSLATPATLVCTEDCKGLCPTCGINRNHEHCACDEPVRGPLAAKLEAMLHRRKDEVS
ncbi:MAG: hypothetical protein A2284_17520 [Deltaproteobacteria bacterium RIFOXYA12_FULL_61_11]|nr:MAG: hypothetical protein A2284_17520 [Deltaproteobacteria bacterium RIFOXYA12_FULL_61_11]